MSDWHEHAWHLFICCSLHFVGLYEGHIGMGYTMQNSENEIMTEGNNNPSSIQTPWPNYIVCRSNLIWGIKFYNFPIDSLVYKIPLIWLD